MIDTIIFLVEQMADKIVKTADIVTAMTDICFNATTYYLFKLRSYSCKEKWPQLLIAARTIHFNIVIVIVLM
ncbi:hypothetical protein ACIQZI_16415 [Peribacillus sp. NPDC096379]|uniref:hypothetical protein n=1 Tax=Peribacillus sp. NPDC096379 TaxID=3364393 RepID=UPI00380BADE3